MTELLFQPISISLLALFITNLVVLCYLLSVRGKSRATWLLTIAFAGFSLLFLANFVTSFLLPVPRWLQKTSGIMFFLGTGTALWALLNFSYRFLQNTFKKEARIAFGLTSFMLAMDLGYAGYVILSDGSQNPDIYHTPLCLGFILWGSVVLLRKRRHSLHNVDSENNKRAPRAYLAYALLNILLIVFLAMQSLANIDLLRFEGILNALGSITLFGFFFGLAAVYINYAPEPTTLQAKLIGLMLVTSMALVVTMSQLQYTKGVIEKATVAAPQHEALQFSPDSTGGYELTELPFRYEEKKGELLHMADDTVQMVSIGFAFSYAGQRWDSLFISPNGAVTFGSPIYKDAPPNYTGGIHAFYNNIPKIVPLYVDLNPTAGGEVYLQRDSTKASISWHNIPIFQTDELNSFYLTLHRDGTIEFVYDDIEALMLKGIRGLYLGKIFEPQIASLGDRLPAHIAPGAALLQDYELAYRRQIHEEVKKLVWLTLGAALFVLLVFPFFFRSSLIKPLARLRKGVRRVNEGKLDEEVPVGVRDEIGYLTHHFNRMTNSLRRYSGEMEGLVAERTAELESSMKELQATQAQLVQQEKLASLGQLTAGIAHEIKNPLNFVNNFSDVSIELVEEVREEINRGRRNVKGEKLPLDHVRPSAEGGTGAQAEAGNVNGVVSNILDDIETNLKKILEHGRRADGIVKSMLLHSRGKSGERIPTNLNKLLDEYVKLAYHGMRATNKSFNIDMQTDFDESIEMMDLVAQDLSRAFLNIINNAMYAAYEHARTTEGRQPVINIKTIQKDKEIEIRFRDNGPGIPEKIRRKIFEPFFTTKPTGEGTGLGLSMAYDIINLHKGTLQIETEPGEFTEFISTLPKT